MSEYKTNGVITYEQLEENISYFIYMRSIVDICDLIEQDSRRYKKYLDNDIEEDD